MNKKMLIASIGLVAGLGTADAAFNWETCRRGNAAEWNPVGLTATKVKGSWELTTIPTTEYREEFLRWTEQQLKGGVPRFGFPRNLLKAIDQRAQAAATAAQPEAEAAAFQQAMIWEILKPLSMTGDEKDALQQGFTDGLAQENTVQQVDNLANLTAVNNKLRAVHQWITGLEDDWKKQTAATIVLASVTPTAPLNQLTGQIHNSWNEVGEGQKKAYAQQLVQTRTMLSDLATWTGKNDQPTNLNALLPWNAQTHQLANAEDQLIRNLRRLTQINLILECTGLIGHEAQDGQ